MASIPWWTWLGVGTIVTFVSIWADLTLFIWLGVIFIVVGIAKLAMFYILGAREQKPVSQNAAHPQVSPRVREYAQSQKALCPRCMANVSPADFYCRYCGTRVR
jgi:hypothetical protein